MPRPLAHRHVLVLLLLGLAGCPSSQGDGQGQGKLEFDWPPQLGKPYPDLALSDHTGKKVRLSSYKGRVILIEPIGMSCPGCNAFAGAHDPAIGRFGGVSPQPGLASLEEYLPRFGGGIRADDPRLVYVHLLLYNLELKAPTLADGKRWAAHFKTERKKNHLVLLGDPRMIGAASYKLIPGFQLVDREFVLQADSTGHHPRHDLYRMLLPMAGKLVRAGGPKEK